MPARREALRGTFDPSYGSYTLGKLLIRTLCVGVERERGMAFTLRGFHDELLGHGGLPFAILHPLSLIEGQRAAALVQRGGNRLSV